ncbi:MAG TPA: hypothetical protein VHH73_05790, partial [Verrucomicrobiae bacterium]|nr:hypothetical protein [Verrucomicrobiae bacterium]
MKRAWGMLAMVALVAGVAVAVMLIQRDDSDRQVYQGKPLAYWVSTLAGKSAASLPANHPAALAMRHFGTNAIPFLISKLTGQSPRWREKGRWWLRRKLAQLHINPARWQQL